MLLILPLPERGIASLGQTVKKTMPMWMWETNHGLMWKRSYAYGTQKGDWLWAVHNCTKKIYWRWWSQTNVVRNLLSDSPGKGWREFCGETIMVLRWSRWVSRRQQSLNGKHYKVDCQLAATKGRIYKNIRILQNIRDRVNFVGKQPKCSIPPPLRGDD